jgi:hypothetical protein
MRTGGNGDRLVRLANGVRLVDGGRHRQSALASFERIFRHVVLRSGRMRHRMSPRCELRSSTSELRCDLKPRHLRARGFSLFSAKTEAPDQSDLHLREADQQILCFLRSI